MSRTSMTAAVFAALMAAGGVARADLTRGVISSFRGQLVITKDELPDGKNDRDTIAKIRAAKLKTLSGTKNDDVVAWHFHYTAFLTKTGATKLRLVFLKDGKQLSADKTLDGVDAKSSVLTGDISISEDEGLANGKTYTVQARDRRRRRGVQGDVDDEVARRPDGPRARRGCATTSARAARSRRRGPPRSRASRARSRPAPTHRTDRRRSRRPRSDVLAPAERDAGLDRDRGCQRVRRQAPTALVRRILLGEQLPARHRHHARRDRSASRARRARPARRDLRAGRDQDHVRAVGEHVGALLGAGRAGLGQDRQVLARQHQARSGRGCAASANFQPATVSFASAGRNTWRFGIARSAIRCSTGWWVGPSSPSPTESCVQTKIAGWLLSDASRTGGRM